MSSLLLFLFQVPSSSFLLTAFPANVSVHAVSLHKSILRACAVAGVLRLTTRAFLLGGDVVVLKAQFLQYFFS